MSFLLSIIVSLGIFLQYILDYVNKTKNRKKIIGGIVVVCTLAGLWGGYAVQQKDSNELKSSLDTLKTQNRHLSLDLGKHDSSLTKIRSQNEFLIELMIELGKEQKEFKVLARNIQEASRVRDVRGESSVKKPSREITKDIENKMIALLSSYKGSKISLTTVMGNQQAFIFAKHLKDILTASGWTIDGVNQAIFTGPIIGTYLKVKSQQYPKRIDTIVQAFKLANIQLEGFLDESLGADDVAIIVGELPQ